MPIHTNATLNENDLQGALAAPNAESPRGVGGLDAYNRKAAFEDPLTSADATVIQQHQNVASAQPVTREGLSASIKGGTKDWQTKVTWLSVEPTSTDGTGFEATVLGPDHKLGESPHDKACPNAKDLNKKIGKTAQTGYVKGHLLNDNLGGPGNDDRNLAAIPRSTNTGGMLAHIETPLKKIVNDRKGWVYLKGAVTHSTWDRFKYASKLTYHWHELKPDLSGDPVKVAGTETDVVLDIPPPNEYAKTDYSKATGTGTYGVAKTGKTADTLDRETAVADVDWTAIVLDDWKAAKIRKIVIATAQQELKQIDADTMKEVVDAIVQSHDVLEDTAFEWIEKEVASYVKGGEASPQLPTKLDEYVGARAGRLHNMLIALDSVLTDKAPTQAPSFLVRLKRELETNDPLKLHVDIIKHMLGRLEALNKEKESLEKHAMERDQIDDLVEPMSPGQTMDVYDHVAGDKVSKDAREMKLAIKKRAREKSDEVLGAAKESKSRRLAERLFALAHDHKGTLAPKDFSELSAAWPALYGTVRHYVNDAFDDETFKFALSGYYNRDARTLEDFVTRLEKFAS